MRKRRSAIMFEQPGDGRYRDLYEERLLYIAELFKALQADDYAEMLPGFAEKLKPMEQEIRLLLKARRQMFAKAVEML